MKKTLIAGVAVSAALGASIALTTSFAHADSAPIQLRSEDLLTAYGDVESQGHVQFAADGLSVVTDAFTPATAGQSKAQEFWDSSSIPLADAGEPQLNWLGTDIKPGINLVVDLDGDSTTSMYSGHGYNGGDAILVGEDAYKTGDGTPVWWATNSSVLSNGAPSTDPLGNGSARHGTLDEWRTLYPHAKVVAEGFSLGSGARGSGVITSETLGANVYSFTAKDAPVTPPAVPTTAPSNVKVAATTTTSVTVGWDDLAGAGTYTVYRNGLAVGTTHDTSFTVGGLHLNTGYAFTVAAGQGYTDLVGPHSAPVTGRTQNVVLAAPTGLKVVSKTATTVTLAANAVANAEGYRWYVSGTNAHFAAHGYSDAATYTVTGLAKGTKYYFVVASDNTTTPPSAASASVNTTTAK
jgi:hypothetical protein